MTAYPKPTPVRDEAYRRLVAALPCAVCSIVGFSQAAHPNTGKAMGSKTDDRDCFPLCHVGGNDCHAAFDQRAMFTKAARREIEPLWANHTRAKLRAMSANDAGMRKIVERVIGL